jgi:hypothetical protein
MRLRGCSARSSDVGWNRSVPKSPLDPIALTYSQSFRNQSAAPPSTLVCLSVREAIRCVQPGNESKLELSLHLIGGFMLRGLLGIMGKRFSSKLGIKLRFASWPTALIGIVVIKAVLSLAVKPGSFLLSYSGISYFLLLLLATGFATRNGIRQTFGSRPFWVFLAIADGLWALNQGLKLYYELGRHMDAPDNSIADPVLFLHIVPLMAAVATLPHRNISDRKPYHAILNSLLLLFSGAFCMVTLFSHTSTCSRRALRLLAMACVLTFFTC